jgi:hypothetical protein
MKSEIINANGSAIDWDKPQFVISGSGTFVATNGKHNGEYFEGVILSTNSPNPFKLESRWLKDAFKPIPQEGITIKFTNE